jgi:hypothetical protein
LHAEDGHQHDGHGHVERPGHSQVLLHSMHARCPHPRSRLSPKGVVRISAGYGHRWVRPTGRVRPVLTEGVAHVHWQLLLFHLTAPLPEHGGEREGRESSRPLAVVRAGRESGEVPPGVGNAGRVAAAGWPRVSTGVGQGRLRSHPGTPLTSIPLCDSARLERSGVLLA